MEVGVLEAKNQLAALLDRVENGEEIVITRHGRPVARLVPHAECVDDKVKAQAAAERIRERAKRLQIGFDWETLKSDRDPSS